MPDSPSWTLGKPDSVGYPTPLGVERASSQLTLETSAGALELVVSMSPIRDTR